jgi:hypothetical protein
MPATRAAFRERKIVFIGVMVYPPAQPRDFELASIVVSSIPNAPIGVSESDALQYP